jgi:meiotically up-regulated gene 157 (Mug157) protein
MEARSIRPKSIVARYNRNYAQALQSTFNNQHPEGITIDDYPDTVNEQVQFRIKTIVEDEPPLQGLIFNKKHEIDISFENRVPSQTIIHKK